MNDREDLPEELLSEIAGRARRTQRPSVLRNRPGVHETIQNARSTLIINILIEIASALILLTGIGYTAMFLVARAGMLEPGALPLYLSILGFFTVGWFTYSGFRLRGKIRALRRHGKPAAPSSLLPPR